jgi:hypothetical protein
VSGGVEFDVVLGAERTEFIGLGRIRLLVGEAQVDEELLADGFADGVGICGVSGEFGRVTYRNFPEFLIALCPSWTLQVRSDAVHTMVLMFDISSGFVTRCRCS